MFLSVLVVATCGLVPEQGGTALGCEIGGTGLFLWIATMWRQTRAYRDPGLEPAARKWLWVRVLGTQAASMPFMIAGVRLVAASEHALLWVAPATIAAFTSGSLNAWVLLVEIQR